MSTDQIRAQIQDTWNEELEHGAFAGIIRNQLAKQSERPRRRPLRRTASG